MQDVVDEYLRFIQLEKGLSENTIAAYRRDLNHYLNYLQERKITHLDFVDRQTLQQWFGVLHDEGRSTKSIARFTSTIRSFHQFALREKYASNDPTVLIETPKYERKLPDVLSIEEIDLLLCTPDISKNNGYRDRTMLELLYATGMRVSELISIEVEDINLMMGFVTEVKANEERNETQEQSHQRSKYQELKKIWLSTNYGYEYYDAHNDAMKKQHNYIEK
ncbi:tyrosine-type recombinase/integrase, partial [Staphylococcus agnetis]|uniref:site-specific integrase n=1 Tax=Staphylococcus agnetis TaxID=985762 RepID=UPI00143167A0